MDIWSLEFDLVMQSILEHVFTSRLVFFRNNIGTSAYLWVLWNKRDFDCDYWVLEVTTRRQFSTPGTSEGISEQLNLEQEKRIQIFRLRKTHHGSRKVGVTNETHSATDDTGEDANSPYKSKQQPHQTTRTVVTSYWKLDRWSEAKTRKLEEKTAKTRSQLTSSVSVKRRLRTADSRLWTRGKMQNVCKMQTAD